MKIPFTKMHGAGNDFIVIDEFLEILIPQEDKPGFVAEISMRHFGVGSDGVIFIQKPENCDNCDVKFSFYNPDGTVAEMCGNGIRCFAKYLYDRGLVKKENIRVETDGGLRIVELFPSDGTVEQVRVDMGTPQVEFVGRGVEINGSGADGNSHRITSVNMGNPHAVLFFDNIDGIDVLGLGRKIRHCTELFPGGTNVHFVQKIGGKENEFRIRTYERGVEGETLACGTGICASAVAVAVNNLSDAKKPMLFHALGGDLIIELQLEKDKVRNVFMTGPAEEIFTGELSK